MSLLAILLFIGTMALSLWGNDPIPASLQQVRPVARERNSRELNSKAKNQPAVGRFDPEHVIGVHVTQIFSSLSGDPTELEALSGADWGSVSSGSSGGSQAPGAISFPRKPCFTYREQKRRGIYRGSR